MPISSFFPTVPPSSKNSMIIPLDKSRIKKSPKAERDYRDNVIQPPHVAYQKQVVNPNHFLVGNASLNTWHVTHSW